MFKILTGDGSTSESYMYKGHTNKLKKKQQQLFGKENGNKQKSGYEKKRDVKWT